MLWIFFCCLYGVLWNDYGCEKLELVKLEFGNGFILLILFFVFLNDFVLEKFL